MSERKNIKRNEARVAKDEFLKTGRKGNGQIHLSFPDHRYLQWLVAKGLL